MLATCSLTTWRLGLRAPSVARNCYLTIYWGKTYPEEQALFNESSEVHWSWQPSWKQKIKIKNKLREDGRVGSRTSPLKVFVNSPNSLSVSTSKMTGENWSSRGWGGSGSGNMWRLARLFWDREGGVKKYFRFVDISLDISPTFTISW